MINDGINNVPENTIAIFPNEMVGANEKIVKNLIKKPDRKRDWFTPNFYRCLPLTIANQYGFVVSSQFSFSATWDGGKENESIILETDETDEVMSNVFPKISTWFGNGILTMSVPFTLRTPPGVNLLTMNPPNYILPNITVMTGVIETDNLRREFTFNLKMQMPNVKVNFPAGFPLAAFMPIPRYYGDAFKLEMAENIFSEDLIIEEMQTQLDSHVAREQVDIHKNPQVGRDYFLGRDIYGNKFKDHQTPKDIKNF